MPDRAGNLRLVPPEPDAHPCPFCHRSGRCAKCAGSGLRHAVRGWLRRRLEVECVACDGTGVCALCRGEGELRGAAR